MKPAILFLLLALACPGAALAQGQYKPGDAGPGQDQQPGPPPDTGNDSGPSNSDSAPAGPMTLDDARTNFSSIVDSFVAARSPNGFWPLKEKATGNVLHLVSVSSDPKTINPVDGSAGVYAGTVIFRDQNTGENVKTQFTVDLSGAEWKVKSMRILGKSVPKKKPAAKAASPKKG